MAESKEYNLMRESMVREQLEERDITNVAILSAMRRVERHKFVPTELWDSAYDDRPLPIGRNQTISQPYVVAYMLQELNIKRTDKILEIGTGSGYEAALLAELADRVFTIEVEEELFDKVNQLFEELGYHRIRTRLGDGFNGWPEEAPFDAIVVSAAPDHIPRSLVKQLAIGGRMILPLGDETQYLVYLEKTKDGLISKDLGAVRFVPMHEGEH